MKLIRYILLLLLSAGGVFSYAQVVRDTTIRLVQDSSTQIKNPAFSKDTNLIVKGRDTIKVPQKHDPRKATLRSLILPGWGQAYNKRYWEIPLVYGALGVTGAIYLYNNKWYKRTRDAYDIKVNRPQDSALVHPRLQPLSANSLQVYRNSFRRDRDYSALWFIIFWGLNVADATVFGHLKDFDVSDDLSLRVNPIINMNGSKGIGLALSFKEAGATSRHRFVMP